MSALSQRAAEIKEKIRIMGNETEILRSETSTKERELFVSFIASLHSYLIS